MPDSAIETFDVAIDRAKYLLRLYHGLVNRRQRSIRSDWAESFCRLMHWPLSSDINRIDSRDAVIVLRDNATLTTSDFDESQLKDTLRASLVMAVSAMDAYFHSKVLAHIVKAASKDGQMPGALKKQTISVADFVAGKRYKRRMTIVRNSMNRQLGFQSLQNPDKIEDALSLIGVKKFWSRVSTRLGTSSDDLKKELKQITRRRNQISHAGDLSKSKKARNKPHDLAHSTVDTAIAFIESLVRESDVEINSQLGI